MKQEEKAESKQKVIERRIKMLEEAGYTQNWTSGIATISEVIDACHLVACDMVSKTDIADPKTFDGYILTYTQMIFSRMQIMPPPPQGNAGIQRLVRGVELPRFDPNQN